MDSVRVALGSRKGRIPMPWGRLQSSLGAHLANKENRPPRARPRCHALPTPGGWSRLGAGRQIQELLLEAEPLRKVLGDGPERVQRVGVITGSGASFLEEAARHRLDTLVTGEGPHHAAIDAAELGMNILYGGHYATETFGVRALAQHLAERFGLEHDFLDLPTGT